ncbi:uncharacterized protein G2W53_028691 [Senna tora]|uniref:F-box associated beta-propeller type 1 domain-containing protein n=1 Tax=Senna tora TaxID=362788 RepID=A0A834T3Y6_9FABA|nr:uncharacterized protein G2W53_028691 [Senna tora]
MSSADIVMILPLLSLSNCSNGFFLSFLRLGSSEDISHIQSCKVLSSFGLNSIIGHECILRLWKDDASGILSSMSIYDIVTRLWSPVQQAICDVSLIYYCCVHINGVIYWIADNEDSEVVFYSRAILAYNITLMTWRSFDLIFTTVGEQFRLLDIDGMLVVLTWHSTVEDIKDCIIRVNCFVTNGSM